MIRGLILFLFLLFVIGFLLFRFGWMGKEGGKERKDGRKERKDGRKERKEDGEEDRKEEEEEEKEDREEEEPFQNLPPTLSPKIIPELIPAYERFLAWYRPFMEQWSSTLQTVYQVDNAVQTAPSAEALKKTVDNLSRTLGRALPPPGGSLPDANTLKTIEDVEALLPLLPTEVEPYQAALEWMNSEFLRSKKELNNALTGGTGTGTGTGKAVDGFDGGDKCAPLHACFKEWVKSQKEEEAQRAERIQRDFLLRVNAFQQPRFLQLWATTQKLAGEAKEIRRKAESGDWIKDVRIGDKEPKTVYTLPEGADALERMKREDPERYKSYQNSYKSLFSVKQLLDQINGGLR